MFSVPEQEGRRGWDLFGSSLGMDKKREKLHTGGLSQRGGWAQVSGPGDEGAGCERRWRSLREKAGLVLTLEKAVPRPGMGEGGAPDRWRSKEKEGATEDCLRQLEISRQGRAEDVAVGDVVREGWRRAWGRGRGCPRRPWGEDRIVQGELAESLGKMLGLSRRMEQRGYPGRALLVLPAACRTPWTLILVAQTTLPALWPAVSPWKPCQFWSGQGFS